MASWQMRALAVLLRAVRKPAMATPERARQRIAAPKADPAPPPALLGRHRVIRRETEGFTCYTVTPRQNSAPAKAVLYWHGGAYVGEITRQHWAFISRLADAGCRVEVPVYGLAPQHSCPEAIRLGQAVYRDLLEDFHPSQLTLAGDSAGGGLALALAQTMPAEGLPQPGRILLLSPWLDLTLANPAIDQVEPTDPWLSSTGLREAGLAWAAGLDPQDPRASPLGGPLEGLAPIEIHIGSRDILHPDCLALEQRATSAGTPIALHVTEGAFHVFMLAPVPEGRRTVEDILRSL